MSDSFLDVAIDAAKAGGDVIGQAFGRSSTVQIKADRSPVTETDVAAERAVLDIIQDAFPEHAYFSEEAGFSSNTSEYVWVIDPLDGTSNFSRGIPICCTSVALTKNGNPIAAAVYAPLQDELFTASLEDPALLNGQAIQLSDKTELRDTLAGLGRSPSGQARFFQIMDVLSKEVRTVRVLGSFALHICYLAAGRIDFQASTNIKFYDGAAATLIAERAGAIVSTFDNQPWRPAIDGELDIVVAPPALHQEILNLVNQP